MAVKAEKRANGFRITTGRTPGAEQEYIVRGASEYDTAYAAVIAQSEGAVSIAGKVCIRQSVSLEELVEGRAWLATVSYATLESSQREPGQYASSFSTRGGTQHISHSKETISRWSALPQVFKPKDHKQAIGVSKDSVDGCDIVVPVFHFSETHVFDALTPEYAGVLFRMTGRVNNAKFRHCEKGECLFGGANGRQRDDGKWEIDMEFDALPNASNLKVGAITITSKEGWQYLWVEFQEVEDANAKALATTPMYAYVERVYDYGDFNQLLIGA